MGLLLAFAPFIVFALVDRLIGPTQALVEGAIGSAILLAREWATPSRSPMALEIGTMVLFGGLAFYAVRGGPTGSLYGVRLCVDAGLLAIALVSIVIRRRFTLQFAREHVSSDVWRELGFVRTNYVITAVWALAFAILVVVGGRGAIRGPDFDIKLAR